MKRYIFILVAVLALAACKKDFLNKVPANQFTQETAFVTYQNFQTYSWALYDYFAGYGNSGATMPPSFSSQENSNSDNISNGSLSSYVSQSKQPAAAAGGTTTSLQISTWSFSFCVIEELSM